MLWFITGVHVCEGVDKSVWKLVDDQCIPMCANKELQELINIHLCRYRKWILKLGNKQTKRTEEPPVPKKLWFSQ